MRETAMTDCTAPTPFLTPAYRLWLDRAAPATIGTIATGGLRRITTMRDGHLSGDGLDARLVSGSETELTRANGLTIVEASYVLDCGGTLLRAFGTGFRKSAEDFSGLRLSLLFEAAQDGPLAHLATRAFVAEQADGDDTLSIHRID
ncbi:DUF3237 family protein [Novosphingobium sp. FSY-8]|uniref:DUF3237 family protein n=1 Tax=Novosphingobium ovatum TaxID=1908523 RepID=A0ABW9XFW9_9SPHN|nr:DUF3237 family protein [Novosphingobium ovatum]NBC37434.1 DUF3237 family protein [Novosphingobium ovatum]